ncbi:hypothetical protein, partial [Cupriavidus sp. amp6]|uniref:hypothetical protein n=1 Tax=Cupriavidus sp. amp6 TaxID=388051 RepID=UPI001E393690
WFPISTIRFSAESSTALYSAPQIPRLYTSFDFSSAATGDTRKLIKIPHEELLAMERDHG